MYSVLAISRLRHPETATSCATRSCAGVSPSLTAGRRRPIAAELVARPVDPHRRADPLVDRQRLPETLLGGRLSLGAPLQRPALQQRARDLRRQRPASVLGERAVHRLDRAAAMSPRAASSSPRQRSAIAIAFGFPDAGARRSRSSRIARSVVGPAGRDQRLDVN